MNKYGVDESTTDIASDGSLNKSGTDNTVCPVCGGPVELHGNVRLCQSCGSRPFEGVNPLTNPAPQK